MTPRPARTSKPPSGLSRDKFSTSTPANYERILEDLLQLVDAARRAAARSVNAVMTATYWEIGRRIVEEEQGGKRRAGYGEELLGRLSCDLKARYGRGFGRRNLEQMRGFYLAWPIPQTLSAELGGLQEIAKRFPLPWSSYVCLLGVRNSDARTFYAQEALRGGWSVRQLERQIGSQFYERTALSRNKSAMLAKAAVAKSEDRLTVEEEVKDRVLSVKVREIRLNR